MSALNGKLVPILPPTRVNAFKLPIPSREAMATTSETTAHPSPAASVAATPQRVVEVTDAERQIAFKKAGRHTALVRSLRVLLPLTALGAVGVYAAILGGGVIAASHGIRFERQEITQNDLKMINPNYRGQTKDGGQFEVRAREATVDLAMTGPIRVDAVEADLIDAKGVTTKVTGVRGIVDRAKSTVDLFDGVTLDATNGMSARMQTAHVNNKENRIIGKTGVVTTFPSGTVRSDHMDFLTKARKGNYTGNVIVDLKPPPAPPTGAQPKDKDQPKQAGLGLRTDSREPISVRAQRLDIDDTARRADFLGQVTAIQGDTKIDSETLHLDYEGPPAKDPKDDKAAPKKQDQIASLLDPAAQANGRVKRIQAHNNVVITAAPDRRITADVADFDVPADKAVLTGNVVMTQTNSIVRANRVEAQQKADTALLTGNVIVEQGPNKLQGQRLAIDRKKGEARLDSPAEGRTPAGRIQTTFVQQKPGDAAPKPKVEAKPETKAQRPNPFGGIKTDPNAPLDIDADVLDVFDQKKVAIFKGRVNARQGDMKLQTVELHAFYTGEGGLLADPTGTQRKPQATTTGEQKSGAQLTHVEARGGVAIEAKDGQTASGDKATFDVKANTMVIEGNVTLTQNKNVIQCARARMNMPTGIFECESERLAAQPQPAPGTAPGAAPVAVVPPAPGQQIRVVIFPKEFRDKQQEKEGAKKSPPANKDAPSAAPAAPGDAPRARPPRVAPDGGGAPVFRAP
jgi:lipopolysaccharide export system protein LptA